MACHYSNSRAPGGSFAAYDMSECYQTHPMCLSITIIYYIVCTVTLPRFTAGSNMAGTETLNKEAGPHTEKPQGAKGGGQDGKKTSGITLTFDYFRVSKNFT